MEKMLNMQHIYMDVLWRRCTCGEDIHIEKMCCTMEKMYISRRCAAYGEDVRYAAYLYGCAMEKMYISRRCAAYGEDVLHMEKMCCIWRRCAAHPPYGEDVRYVAHPSHLPHMQIAIYAAHLLHMPHMLHIV